MEKHSLSFPQGLLIARILAGAPNAHPLAEVPTPSESRFETDASLAPARERSFFYFVNSQRRMN